MLQVREMNRTASLTEAAKADLEAECGVTGARWCLLRGLVFYIPTSEGGGEDGEEDTSFSRQLAATQIRFCGGRVSDQMEDRWAGIGQGSGSRDLSTQL